MNNEKKKYHMNDADWVIENNEFLLDVREPVEYEAGHIKGAENISVNELENRLNEIPENKKIYVYCQRGRRGATAVCTLQNNGFDAVNLEEGYSVYTGRYDTASSVAADHSHQDSSVLNRLIFDDRIKVEASGMQCPGPLLKVNEVMSDLKTGEQMEITVTDTGFSTDIEAWAKKTGNTVLKKEIYNDKVIVVLEKNAMNTNIEGHKMTETKDGATMVVFSGDLDKALASFIIAAGAKSMGKEVTMFFTFWGLNVIKDPNAPKRNKKGLDKTFSMMMPKSASKLPISKMNMFGLGSKMIQHVMKNKKVDALTEMIEKADALGVKMIACTMSMDIMAVEKEELLPHVNFGGVGTYLGDAENSNLNLFI